MLNRTGLILKLEDNIAFVISKDCMYFKIKRKPGMLKGQTVEFNQSDIAGNRRFIAKHYYLAAAAAAVLIIIASIVLLINPGIKTNNNIYAFIDIDINPSLEITIDEDRHIQNLYPLNKDAEILLSGLDMKEVSMEDGLSKIIDKSKELGFLNTAKKDVILISAALNGKKESSGTLIMDICSDVYQLKDKNIETQVIDVPLKTRKLALENNISMGRYVLYEKARESGLDVSIESVKAISLENILEQVNLNGIQVNNSTLPLQIPKSGPPQGGSGNTRPVNTNNPHQGKGNNPALVQEYNPKAILQYIPTLTPAPVKEVQSDLDKNTYDDFDQIPTPTPKPTPSLTPTATATLLPTATPPTQGSIVMSLDTTEIYTIGQVICATLEANNIRQLSGFQANLEYDPQVIQPVDSAGRAYSKSTIPESGTLLHNSNFNPISSSFNDISNGRLNFGISYIDKRNYKNGGAEEHTGSLAVIRFKVLQLKNTSIIFQNTNNSLKEKSGIVLFDWDGGTIPNFEVIQPSPMVVNLEITPSITPVSSRTPSYATATPDFTWTPVPTPTATVTPTPIIKNYDLNGDGYINIEDCLLIDNAIVTRYKEPNYNKDIDLNNDGYIDIVDKRCFLAYLKNHTTPLSTTLSTPYPTNIPVTTPLSRNWISMSILPTEINAVGQIIEATLEVNNIVNLAGFQANLQYDPQVLQPVTAAGNSYDIGTTPENVSLLLGYDYSPVSFSFNNNIPNGVLTFGRSYSKLKVYKKNGVGEHTGSLAKVRFKVLQLKDTNIIFQNTNNSLKEKSGIVLSDWDGEVISNFEVVQPGTLKVNPAITSVNPSITWTLTPTPTATPIATPTATSTLAPTPATLTPTATPTSTPTIKSFDINNDGSIDEKDMEALDKALNSIPVKDFPNYNAAADLNGNQVVSIVDRMLLMEYFEEHSIPIPATPVMKSLDINGDGIIGDSDRDVIVRLENTSSIAYPAADLNCDDIIDHLDSFILFIYQIENPDTYIHSTSTPEPTPEPTPTPTPPPIKNFDINGDGFINMEDSQLIDQALNTRPGKPNYNPACDLNGDGAVNMRDKVLFIGYLSKHTPTVPTISDTPCPTSVTQTPVPTLESTQTPTPTPTSTPTVL